MLEILLLIGTSIVIAKIAALDNESGLLWGGITCVACIASLFIIPYPFIRILGVGVLCFLIMFVSNLCKNKA